jgi:AAA domain
MSKLSTHSASKTHRCLIYGGPKTGKTLLAGKLAEHYRVVWFDLENGHDTLFQLPPEYQDNIDLICLPDTRSYPIAIETCLKVVKGPVSICEEHGKVACMLCKKDNKEFNNVDLNSLGHDSLVVFDSLTQLSNSAISFVTKGKPDDYSLEFGDWGNLGKLLDIFLSHIQQSGYNCIVISHETEAETEAGKTVLVPVGGTRNFSRNIAKYFDHVIYAERKNRKHVFASSSTYAANILTGSRTGVVMEGTEDGSLLRIFKPELFAPQESVVPNSPVKNTLGTALSKLNDKGYLPRPPEATTQSTTTTQVIKPQGGVSPNTQAILDRLKKKP